MHENLLILAPLPVFSNSIDQTPRSSAPSQRRPLRALTWRWGTSPPPDVKEGSAEMCEGELRPNEYFLIFSRRAGIAA